MFHHLAHEVLGLLVDFLAVYEDLSDVLAEVIADCANDQIAFLIDQEWCLAFLRCAGDGFPDLQQIVQIPLQLFGRLAYSRGAHDQPHAVWNLQGA